MKKEMYLISEAEKLTGEKAHVLRYWEEELGLSIGRNPMGHRYYTAQNIRVFLTIKELKKQGLHLKAIKERLNDPDELFPLPEEEEPRKEQEPEVPDPVILPAQPMQDTPIKGRGDGGPDEPHEPPLPDRQQQFYQILDRLIRQLSMQKRQEERSRRVDEAIRKRQQTSRETAATLEQGQRGRKKKRR